jgi:hypothetical protein
MSFGAWALGAWSLHVAALPSVVHAQHADAGVQRQARAVAQPKPPAEPSSGGASGELPKAIDPTMLSEGVRAGLAERAAGRHPGTLPSARSDLREPGAREPAVPPGSPLAAARNRIVDEPLRRGEAHKRRVQALETDEGITVLSNRINSLSGSPRLASVIAEQPPAQQPLHDSPPVEDEALASAEPGITATHSLRPSSSRRLDAKNTGSGLGWLLWPFVLFVTTGAVVGTLWFRKKTN